MGWASRATARTRRTSTSSSRTSRAGPRCWGGGWKPCESGGPCPPPLRCPLGPNAAGPLTLLLVEQAIGDRDQVLCALHPGLVGGEPDAHRHAAAAEFGDGGIELRRDPVGEDPGALEVRVGQEDEELVAAVAYRKVHRTGLGGEDPAEHAQDLIAGQVAVPVVVVLEIVEIEEEQDQTTAAAGRGELPGEVVLELPAVRQPGQRVGHREGVDL